MRGGDVILATALLVDDAIAVVAEEEDDDDEVVEWDGIGDLDEEEGAWEDDLAASDEDCV